ncbi:MAG: hypothetical protein IMY88_01600, partial [Chloroflexi bacterium]|nr:hypothetical protein [Chloroflexota bacterium]
MPKHDVLVFVASIVIVIIVALFLNKTREGISMRVEEAERLAEEQARKKTWLAQEKVIAEATEARRAREN